MAMASLVSTSAPGAQDFLPVLLEGPERPEGKAANNRGASAVGDRAQPPGKCRETRISAHQCARQPGTDTSGLKLTGLRLLVRVAGGVGAPQASPPAAGSVTWQSNRATSERRGWGGGEGVERGDTDVHCSSASPGSSTSNVRLCPLSLSSAVWATLRAPAPVLAHLPMAVASYWSHSLTMNSPHSSQNDF